MMRRISQSEWIADRESFDRAVAATPEISRFCSSQIWSRAARRHLLRLGEDEEETESAEPSLRLPASAIVDDTAIWRDEEEDQWIVFARSPWGYWQPLEAAWMFSCPLIGSDPEQLVESFREAVAADLDITPGFAIGGVPFGGRLHRALRSMRERGGLREYREYPATDCLAIDLADGGAETWLAHRSKKFRRSLRTAERRCGEAGLEIEAIEQGMVADPTLFDRLLALQPRTAKWASGTDIFQAPGYIDFYREIFEDLNATGRLRILIATRDGEDVAYIFGGVFDGEYRGLQMSYAEEFASLGVGNWLQWENLRRRADEGIDLYDLGMESEYKLRWADRTLPRLIAYVVI